jgi:hypothetical protein
MGLVVDTYIATIRLPPVTFSMVSGLELAWTLVQVLIMPITQYSSQAPWLMS